MKIELVLLLILHSMLLVRFNPATAQTMLGTESIEVEMLRPSVGFSFSFEPRRNFRDVIGSYSLQSNSMDAMIPIIEQWGQDSKGPSMYTLLVRGAAASIRPDVSMLNRQHQLYTSSLGLTFGMSTTSRSMYSLTASLGFAEDDKTVEDFHARFTGSFLATYPLDFSSTLLYGLNYSYNFDRELFLPMLGVRWNFSDRWVFNSLLPFFARVSYQEDRNISVGMALRLHGNRFRFSNEGVFGSEPETISLRVFETQIGIDANIRLHETLLLRAELGVMGGRRIGFAFGNDEFLSSCIQSSGYLTLGAKFLFGGN